MSDNGDRNAIKADELRKVLHRRAKELSTETVAANGKVPAEQVEELKHLASLLEIYSASKPPKRWVVLPVFLVTLILVTLLLVIHRPEMEIELDLSLSELGFVMQEQQALTSTMKVSVLGVSGLRQVQLPRTRGRRAETFPAEGTDLAEASEMAVRLSGALGGARPGALSLSALIVPPETGLLLRHTGVPWQYRLSHKGSDRELRANVDGAVKVEVPGVFTDSLYFSSPKSIILHPDTHWVDLDLTFPDTSKQTISEQLSVKKLSFSRVDRVVDTEKTLVRQVSTVLSGMLYIESLNGKQYLIRPGETITFKECVGQIRSIQLHGDHIQLNFRGRVRGMGIGTGTSHKNLMPRYLEWLSVRHGLKLFWGALIYLLGLVLGVLRFWGRVS